MSKLAGGIVIPVLMLSILSLPQAPAAEAQLEQISPTVFIETKNKKMWSVERSRRLKREEEVRAYLQQLNLGEFSDWRLPNKDELAQLFAVFDLKNYGEVKIRLEGSYWLIDEDGEPFVGSWEIGDQCGPSRTFYTGTVGHVRAIRP